RGAKVGVNTRPTVRLSASSGSRSGFPPDTTNAPVVVAGACRPAQPGRDAKFGPAQGSTIVEKPRVWPPNASAKVGARNPVPHEPRTSRPSTGLHLRPTFGLLVLPKRL